VCFAFTSSGAALPGVRTTGPCGSELWLLVFAPPPRLNGRDTADSPTWTCSWNARIFGLYTDLFTLLRMSVVIASISQGMLDVSTRKATGWPCSVNVRNSQLDIGSASTLLS